MAFYTIYARQRLTPNARAEVTLSRGRQVHSRVAIRRLLRNAGFVDVEEIDVTRQFATVARRWLRAWTRHGDELRAIKGDQFDEEQRWRHMTLDQVERGWLRRSLFVARRPPGRMT